MDRSLDCGKLKLLAPGLSDQLDSANGRLRRLHVRLLPALEIFPTGQDWVDLHRLKLWRSGKFHIRIILCSYCNTTKTTLNSENYGQLFCASNLTLMHYHLSS